MDAPCADVGVGATDIHGWTPPDLEPTAATFSSGGAEKMTQHSQSPGLTGTLKMPLDGTEILDLAFCRGTLLGYRIKSNIPQHCRSYLYRWLQANIVSDSYKSCFPDFSILDIYIPYSFNSMQPCIISWKTALLFSTLVA